MSNRTTPRWRLAAALLPGLAPALLAAGLTAVRAEDLDKKVLDAEEKRVAAIEKVRPSVVAVMSGGGSGVLIDPDGYALTNFHVVAAARSPFMKCGLPDGVLYDAVLVGLDKVGDVALIKLLPKKDKDGKVVAPPGGKFPFAKMGDSDKVQAGDWSLAMGNPFLLATDFTPTVTFGLISGVHRYQYPEGGLLEYTDCIQIDTSINPGNSGGPLFNMDGELIGINGRGSFEKRGRVNSGVGYAISSNQIKNFMGQLRAGMDTDHATLGALLESESEDDNKVVVKQIIESDALRRGLDAGDQVTWFAGRRITTVNQYKNILGIFPRGWRVPMTFKRQNEKNTETRRVLVRLMGAQRREVADKPEDKPPQPGPRPGPRPGPAPGREVAKYYEAKAGFANYYFNKVERDRLLAAFKKHGDFSKVQGNWLIRTGGLLYAGGTRGKRMSAQFAVKDRGAADGKNDLVQAVVDGIDFSLEPLKVEDKDDTFTQPPGSGGLMLALYQYRQLLAFGPKYFGNRISHGGVEPFYPPGPVGEQPDYAKQRVDCEVLLTESGGVPTKWYFSVKDGTLLGFEVTPDRDKDPCEVYLSEYQKDDDGRELPRRIEVRHADKVYAIFNVNTYKLDPAK